jgi:hypothetical protein
VNGLVTPDVSRACASSAPDGRHADFIDLGSPAQAKISLFRSLFRGREDVYARRFESSTTGKSGYAPACANEWVRGICRKPQIKCSDCAYRKFLPLTDEVIFGHLSGHEPGNPSRRPFVAGVYPMLDLVLDTILRALSR